VSTLAALVPVVLVLTGAVAVLMIAVILGTPK